MSPVARRNLLAAPELIVIDLVHHALAALSITLDVDAIFTGVFELPGD